MVSLGKFIQVMVGEGSSSETDVHKAKAHFSPADLSHVKYSSPDLANNFMSCITRIILMATKVFVIVPIKHDMMYFNISKAGKMTSQVCICPSPSSQGLQMSQ